MIDQLLYAEKTRRNKKMADNFRVQISGLNSGVTELVTLNQQFTNVMKQLQESVATLSAQWEGEAKEKYNTAMNQDVEMMLKFSELMQRYIEALADISKNYSNTEQTNVGIIK
jgi:WXG100 family type VII secretion target